MHAPQGMAADAWQRTLRRQFGRDQDFKFENTGAEPVFSEFRVINPASGGRYRVAIRGAQPGRYLVRVVDEHGRADSREVVVTAAP